MKFIQMSKNEAMNEFPEIVATMEFVDKMVATQLVVAKYVEISWKVVFFESSKAMQIMQASPGVAGEDLFTSFKSLADSG